MPRKKATELAQQPAAPDVFDEAIAAQEAAAASPVQEFADADAQPQDPPVSGHIANPSSRPRPGRGWTERYEQPVKYRRFVARDMTRREQIMFKFDLPAGQDKPDERILAVMREHKETSEGYKTGLHFDADPVHGKVWKLPATPLGRDTADRIDTELNGVAHKIEAEQGISA
jgi:hypothetical protein